MKYIDGNITDNPFVNEIESKINEIKQDEKERGAYMQYDLHLRQIEEEAEKIGIAKGEKIGIAKSLLNSIKSLMENANYTVEQAMKILNIPQEEHNFYLSKLQLNTP